MIAKLIKNLENKMKKKQESIKKRHRRIKEKIYRDK